MWIDDQILKTCEQSESLQLWIPKKLEVILGSTNKSETEVIEKQCKLDSVPVLRRYGGGGTVILHQGCVIISYGIWVKHQFKNEHYFNLINKAVIGSLSKDYNNLNKLHQAGISDIAYKDKKICGTSMFRSRNYLLYQASILAKNHIDLIEKYISYPDKEPDYRKGKSHRDFLTSLNEIDNNITPNNVLNNLKENFSEQIKLLFGDELIKPQESQIKYILRRANKK